MKRLARLASMFVLAATVVTGCSTADEKSTTGGFDKEPYRLGAIVSATGQSAPLGESERNVLLLEVDKINKDGGIDGHRVELYVEDDQSDKGKAVTATDRLISEKKVLVILGGSSTSTSMAIKSRATKAKIPFVSLAAGIPITATDAKWVFRVAPSDALAAQKVVDYLSVKVRAKKIVVLNDENQFGESGAAQLAEKGPKAGIAIAAREVYKTGETDIPTQLTKLRSQGADVLVVWDATKTFIELAGDAAEGVVFPSVKVNVPTSMEEGTKEREVADSFIEDYKTEYGKDPDNFAGHGYDGFWIVCEALKRSGGDSAKLRDEIEKTKNFVGIDGVYTYTATDHDGLKTDDLIVVKIVGGKWTLAE